MTPRPKRAPEGAQARWLAGRLGWQERAACRGVDPERFFTRSDEAARSAIRICAACPVRVECLGYAVAAGERFGVWGGSTEDERARMTREERQRVVAEAAARAA